ncbi:MAG: hypothetical protein LRY66_09310 [Saccharospirillaceae bacterium]|nr:hypothetical protein [Saccharospirillaceae bacterium]MCD8531541.1 hypothetical protein [Saccharospirillaceae bacterium]
MRRLQRLLLACSFACSLPLAAVQAQTVMQDNEWQVISLYPPHGVYQAELLVQLVAAVEGLWQVQGSDGQPLLRTIDSLASMNVIVAQQEEVRFRRIIEKGELNPAGMQRLQALVEEHPLVQRRLVSADAQATHLWLRLKQPATVAGSEQLSEHLRASLNAAGNRCVRVANEHGPLAGRYMTQWQYDTPQRVDGVAALQALAEVQQQLSHAPEAPDADHGRLYSVLDLLSYLGTVLGGDLLGADGLPQNNAALAQMYMMAESLRSRDLQTLARPDFRQLQLVVLGHKAPLSAPPLAQYQLTHTSIWTASARDYHVLDCRAQALVTSENSL